MIDLKYAYNSFEEYRKNYPDKEGINLKVAHMKRVMRNIFYYHLLGLNMRLHL